MKADSSLNLFKINLPGGIVSVGKLYEILETIKNIGIDEVSFGKRQQMLWYASEQQVQMLHLQLPSIALNMEINREDYPNIVSSYVADEIFATASWLSEGVYKDILDSFHFAPRLKVNIVDSMQNLVPFFTGNLNFISSETSNYWYLCVRFPKTNQIFHWPALIYSGDIAEMCQVAETIIMSEHHLFYHQTNIDGNLLVKKVLRKIDLSTQQYDQVLRHTDFQLPFYEGINHYVNQKLWLGIYRRNEVFDIHFLLALCQLCLDYRIGQLYTTPWKSIVIKNIPLTDRKHWSVLLNRFRINVRHAANELNWQLEDRCDEALQMKRIIVRAFEDADLRTTKLCFAIKTKKQTGLFGSIVVQIDEKTGAYQVAYTRNFNPNTKEYIPYGTAKQVTDLAEILIRLCHLYYDTHSIYHIEHHLERTKSPKKTINEDKKLVYQCRLCATQYHPLYGDPLQGIAAGTDFLSLKAYRCFTCEAPKSAFIPFT